MSLVASITSWGTGVILLLFGAALSRMQPVGGKDIVWVKEGRGRWWEGDEGGGGEGGGGCSYVIGGGLGVSSR